MALPKLNTPIYSYTLPDSKREIKFRPLLAGEYKALLTIVAFEDVSAIANTVLEVLTRCVADGTDVTKLSFVDVESLFLHLYAKSSENAITIQMRCTEPDKDGKPCDTSFNLPVVIADVTVTENPISNIVDLGDGVGIKLKYPPFGAWFIHQDDAADDDAIVIDCIESIFDKEGVYEPLVDASLEEVLDFLEALPQEAAEQITDFIDNMPEVYWSREITCPKCKHTERFTLQGLYSFFA